MIRRSLRWCVALLVVACIGLTGSRGSTPTLLGPGELQDYRGGDLKFCVDAIADIAGVDCHECTSNGQGGWTKCWTSANDMKWQDHFSQSPAEKWEFDEVQCFGQAQNYTASDCQTATGLAFACGRTFTRASFSGYDPGVNCPPGP